MAKSGQILLDDGIDPGDLPLADSVVFAEATPTNLGGIVADMLEKSVDPLCIVVDFDNRKVYGQPLTSFAIRAEMFAGADMKIIGSVTRDDPTRKSSPVTLADGADVSAIPALLALKTALVDSYSEVKPSKSVAAIVSSVEDALAKLATADEPFTVTGTFAIIDQTDDGQVEIRAKSTGFTPTGAIAKVKQIVSTGASGPAPLAFE